MDELTRNQHSGPLIEKVIRFLARSRQNGGVFGLRGSSASFLTAAAAAAGAPPIVVALPTGDAASSWAVDIRFFLGQDEQFKQPLTDEVVRYPSSETAPYAQELENDTWMNRSAALFRFAEGPTPRILCVGLDSMLRRVTPREAVLNASMNLTLGQELDREELLRKLIRAGYSRTALVEDAGDVSVRGFVIDVYSPMYPYPVRIEQTGDFIESMRFFDPATQRSKDAVNEIVLSPIHLLLLDDANREEGLERLFLACEDRGTEKRVRQRLLDDLRHGIRFPGAEHYLPYFFPQTETIFDYIPQDAIILLPDSDSLTHVFDELEDDISRGWHAAVQEGLPVPSPESLYVFRSEFYSRVKKFRTIVMGELEIEDPGTESYRIPCETNHDIRSELLKAKGYDAGMTRLVKLLERFREDGAEVYLTAHTQGQAHRLMRLLEPYELHIEYRGVGFDRSNLSTEPSPGIRLYVGGLSCGFRMESSGLIVITEEEIFGSRVRLAPRKRARGALLSSLTDLAEGEAVVHEDYGIGIFRGLLTKEFDGIAGEVMVIEFAGKDLLYHPVERLQSIQKYVSGSEEPPRLDRLGGKLWQKTKARVKKSIKEMANELLEIYAKRRVVRREPYSPTDETYAAFEAAFEYEETPDQTRTIQEVMESMDSDVPMDRLVCGDAGYGKTEVAIRAAFRAIMDGKQVAVLVPTTVLAQQHYETFKKRFDGYPILVEMLSRFRSASDQKQVRENLKKGKVDLVIGTHKLLSKDVEFKDLGFLVVDEEQRFGVKHKETIKKYKANVDVLTMTATPIPRTLNMSLTGIRDLSVIETPPASRRAVRTHVVKKSPEIIREAVIRELSRGGQVFYLFNRVQRIHRVAEEIRKLAPEGRYGIAHGQMGERELEQVMYDFVTGKINVLVSTSIIESGLDIPRANTILIERADAFGLADLYQLRGRVGRSNVRAHAYLMTPPETAITQDAMKRLAVIQEHSDLGQGFRVAMRDMEIRGAGSILGGSQSGHVAQVGYEMYLDLLEEAVHEIKGEEPAPKIDPEIRLKVEAVIPEDYTPEPQQRMNLYKRLSRAADSYEIDGVEDEMIDLYGKPPVAADRLLRIMRIRLSMKNLLISRLDYNERDLVFTFARETAVPGIGLAQWAQSDSRVRLIPEDRVAVKVGKIEADARISMSIDMLRKLKAMVPADAPEHPPRDPFPVTKLKKARALKTG